MSGCPESTRLALTIQQSGVYLHGALRLVEQSEDTSLAKEDLTLGGLWEQQQLSLTGSAYLPATCQAFGDAATKVNSNQELRQIPVTIQGTVSDAEKAEFTGKITLEASNSLEFTAIREALTTQSGVGH